LDNFWSEIAVNSNRVFIVMPVIGSDDIKETDTQKRSISVSPNLSVQHHITLGKVDPAASCSSSR